MEISELASVLQYENGVLSWMVTRGKARAGAAVTRTDQWGYVCLEYKGKCFLAHRIIWALANGAWPAEQIDHINGDRTDNRIENLRECSNTQNQATRRSNAQSSSQYKGVCAAAYGKYKASIRKRHIGHFDSEIEAAQAYDKEAVKEYGEFARLNFGGQS